MFPPFDGVVYRRQNAPSPENSVNVLALHQLSPSRIDRQPRGEVRHCLSNVGGRRKFALGGAACGADDLYIDAVPALLQYLYQLKRLARRPPSSMVRRRKMRRTPRACSVRAAPCSRSEGRFEA